MDASCAAAHGLPVRSRPAVASCRSCAVRADAEAGCRAKLSAGLAAFERHLRDEQAD